MNSSKPAVVKTRKNPKLFAASTIIILTVAFLTLPKSNKNTEACVLSKRKSFGFFCESDANWEHRTALFNEQQQKQISEQSDKWYDRYVNKWWQFNYEPDFSCAYEKRIGSSGDGGKWLCDPHRVRELLVERNKKCVVLSIGSNNDFDFERGIQKEFPTCEIHTYDHTITPENVPPQVNFHSLGLASKNSDKLKSFATLLSDLNLTDEHSIEVLKLDIEGYEWEVFVGDEENPGILTNEEFPFIRQILIEVHPPRDSKLVRSFFRLMKERGYVIVHKEPNTMVRGKLQEYVFFKTDL